MLSADEVKHIAMLARIGLNDKEVLGYQKDLSGILDFFQELEELDTSHFSDAGMITGLKDVARIDEVREVSKGEVSALLENAPDTKDGFIKVRSVF